MDYLQINELYHHGIKGMKWGVRRFQNEDGSLTPKGLKRQNNINKEAAKYENKAFKAELHGNIKAADTYSEIASKLKKQDLTHKTYDEIKRRSNLKVAAATVAGLLGGALLTTSVARYLNRNKPASSTDHSFIAEQIALGTLWCGEIGFITSRVANSSNNSLKRYNKQFASSSDKKDSAKHSDIYTDELYHFNIKGAKWGIRRYQNYDGTLTEAGKLRYGANSLSEMKPGSKAQKLYSKDVQDSYDAKKSIALESKNISESIAGRLGPKKGSKRVNKSNYSTLSDDDLRKKINRLALEKQYGDLSGDNKYKMTGREVTREILQTAGAVAGIGASAAAIMLAIRQMRLGG